MRLIKTIRREELDKDDFFNDKVQGGDGDDKQIVPNVESLAMAVMYIVDKYMQESNGGDI